MLEPESELLEQLKSFIRAKKFDEAEELWLQEVVEAERQSDDFHQAVVRFFTNKQDFDRLESFYSILISQRAESENPARAIQVSTLLLEFNPHLEFLRPLLVSACKATYADRDAGRLDDFLETSGLGEDKPNILEALEHFEELVGASKGQVFRHRQWGLGVVRELDAQAGWAIMDFPKKPKHRMTLDGIRNFLERIPGDHLLARMATQPAELREEMASDPAACIRLALKSSGGKLKGQELKKLLTDRFLAEDEYKRWWAKAKDAVRLDPYIDTEGKGASLKMTLRKEPRSFLDEVLTSLVTAKNAKQRREVLRDVARHAGSVEVSDEDRNALRALFSKPVEDGSLKSPVEELAHGLLVEEYRSLFGEDYANPVDWPRLLDGNVAEVAELVAGVGVFELQRLALDHLKSQANRDDVHLVMSAVMADGGSKLAAWIDKALVDMGHADERDHAVERIFARPGKNPEVYIWCARRILEGSFLHLTDAIPPIMVCEGAVSVLAELADEAVNAEGKKADAIEARAQRFRTFLQEGGMKNVRHALREAGGEEARSFLAQVVLCNGLSNQLRDAIESLVHREHPALKRTSKQEEEEERRKPAYHYALEGSIDKQRTVLSNILNREIPENSKAIQVAREHGDLRENAEYHAAKDRQKLLMQQAAELEELIARARIVDLGEVRSDEVRFGTRVSLRRRDDDTVSHFTVMGMWEADADKNIISYLTPLGQQLLNRKVGEEFDVRLPDGKTIGYKLEAIEVAQGA